MDADSTATTAGARDHARAQEAAAATAPPIGPTVPASRWPGPDQKDLVWADTLLGPGYAHRRLAAGTHIELTDLEGDACAHVLLFNALAPAERLNVADTVKVQWQIYSGPGQLLLSDQARVLASVVEDSSTHHDAIYGTSAARRNAERYGDGSIEGSTPSGRDLLALAGAKHGLERRDIAPSMSFFQGISIDDAGRPQWRGSAGPGTRITLRTELPAIVLIANVPHPLDPRDDYVSTPLQVVARPGSTTTPDDPLWNTTPEGRRAFENTSDYRKGLGL